MLESPFPLERIKNWFGPEEPSFRYRSILAVAKCAAQTKAGIKMDR